MFGRLVGLGVELVGIRTHPTLTAVPHEGDASWRRLSDIWRQGSPGRGWLAHGPGHQPGFNGPEGAGAVPRKVERVGPFRRVWRRPPRPRQIAFRQPTFPSAVFPSISQGSSSPRPTRRIVFPPTAQPPSLFALQAATMSSPAGRRSTPRRSARNSAAPSSPAAAASAAAQGNGNGNTPRNRPSQLASSPLFYQSSSPAPAAANGNGAAANPSSPLRQMSNSQSTNGPATRAPSSPLRQETETQETDDVQMGERTPRASGLVGGKPLPPLIVRSSAG